MQAYVQFNGSYWIVEIPASAYSDAVSIQCTNENQAYRIADFLNKETGIFIISG